VKPRKPPSEFAIKRGRLIQRAREEAGLSQAQLAEKIGVTSREAVSQYESGKIGEISEKTCRALAFVLGLQPGDLAEDPSVYQFTEELPTMSAEARRIARKWDALPPQLRAWINSTISGYEVVTPAVRRTVAPRKRKKPKS